MYIGEVEEVDSGLTTELESGVWPPDGLWPFDIWLLSRVASEAIWEEPGESRLAAKFLRHG